MRLTVRAYNVLFGDCILVSWDEDDRRHHAWIDFGNYHNDRNDVLKVVYDDVLARTGGQLDLILITHRHIDHLEGFHLYRDRLGDDFQVDRVWHAHVTEEADRLFQLASRTLSRLLPTELRSGDSDIAKIYANNLALTTKARMDEIAGAFPAGSLFAIHRELDLAASGARPPGMRRMTVDVLGPEQDSGRYLMPLREHLTARKALDGYFRERAPGRLPDPPAGAAAGGGSRADDSVDADAPPDFFRLADFARLRRQLRGGGMDLLAAVDRTRNNTSIVSRWSYQGITLLLTGDAELGSWEIIRANGADLSAALIKVGHHGSINASPTWSYEQVFPSRSNSNAALLSTNPARYTGENEVPKAEVVAGWTGRLRWPSRFRRTDVVDPGSAVEIIFDR